MAAASSLLCAHSADARDRRAEAAVTSGVNQTSQPRDSTAVSSYTTQVNPITTQRLTRVCVVMGDVFLPHHV
jgi:hypothetical protein